MKSTFRAIFFIFLLALLFGGAFLLPKFLQGKKQGQPWVDAVASQAPTTEPKAKQAVMAESPWPASVEPLLAETATPPPAVAAASSPVDMGPFLNAFAEENFAKAEEILGLMKDSLPAGKIQEYHAALAKAKDRAAKGAQEQEASRNVLVQGQIQLAESMKELSKTTQQTQQEVKTMKVENAAAPAPGAASSPPRPASEKPPAMVAVSFDLDSSLFPGPAAKDLAPLMDYLVKNDSATVEIRGYSDKQGSAEYNLGLAKARAYAVREEFRKAGIALARMEVISYGSSHAPQGVADSSADRRVEVEAIP